MDRCDASRWRFELDDTRSVGSPIGPRSVIVVTSSYKVDSETRPDNESQEEILAPQPILKNASA